MNAYKVVDYLKGYLDGAMASIGDSIETDRSSWDKNYHQAQLDICQEIKELIEKLEAKE